MADGRKVTFVSQSIVSFAPNPKAKGSVIHRIGDAPDLGVAVRETSKVIRDSLEGAVELST